tara:strand:+ start:1556 stop:2305 length:750 start_codon:yes stop_codon:yes gene_type:complete
LSYKNFAILIPSRIGSTRLKNKALIEIDKKPLIEHVIRGAIKSDLKVPIIVATDTKDIIDIAERCGQIGILTSKDHESGSDRINEALKKFDPQKKINKIIHLQGDLPNVSKKLIISLANIIKSNKCIATPVVKADKNEIFDENIVKCVASFESLKPKAGEIGNALYFSRLPIPWGDPNKWHHLGIYAWDRTILEKYIKLKPSNLEMSEKLEQLRALEAGINIKILVTTEKPIGIDTIEDLNKFKQSVLK